MSINKVREYLARFCRDKDIMEFGASSATVELAAAALGVNPAKIAKTLAFYDNDGCILVVTAGDAKIDNPKFKAQFSIKAKMLAGEDVKRLTGYEAGGVCPFANPEGVKTYLDISLKRFDIVYPACGSSNSGIGLSCDDLYKYSAALGWVDLCKVWDKTLS